MKKIFAIVFVALTVSSLAKGGGAIGGGSGLVLELETANITRDQFESLVLSGTQDLPVTLNKYPAKVRSVNFQMRTVELDVDGFDDATVLKAVDAVTQD
jgi:hypothetical protein